jgi:hypothetical protein
MSLESDIARKAGITEQQAAERIAILTTHSRLWRLLVWVTRRLPGEHK